MNWAWFSPTRIYFGAQALQKNCQVLKNLGQKALIVTGRGGSSSRNGALADICSSLQSVGQGWIVFNEVEANPSLETVRKGADLARKEGVDFVVGVGGGSPLDAAKAIAILAVNDLDDEGLFSARFNYALPIAAIPTTAGSGSEVTPYSIITYYEINNKKSIASPLIFPRLAFVDPGYTCDLPEDITIDTAIDTFSHAYEGFLSLRANPLSDLIAREVMKTAGLHLRQLAEGCKLEPDIRESLMYASMLAGIVISHTGTTIPHSLGYSFTFYKGIPHGRANGMVIPAYTAFNLESDNSKAGEALEISGFKTLEYLTVTLRFLTGQPPVLSEKEQDLFAEKCSGAKNMINNIRPPSPDDLRTIMRYTAAES